ncbi:MAG: hypothetical protein QOI68_1178, partial [Pseudonocardiales bacterium]|nr:hypothetical protein [Pseudonocardiales bacterium]
TPSTAMTRPDTANNTYATRNDTIPLLWENYDIVLSSDALGAAQPLIAALRDGKVMSAIPELSGYDTHAAGVVEELDGADAAS